MNDPHLNYWLESLECSLDALGLFDAIPKEARQQIAKDLMHSSEMKSMAFGEHCIPNPLAVEVSKLKKSLESEKRETEEWQSAFRKNVSIRRGCPETSISINKDGMAVIHP